MNLSLRRLALTALLALAVVSALALAGHAGPEPSAPPKVAVVAPASVVAPGAVCGPDDPSEGLERSAIGEPTAQTPHCCTQADIDACRTGCRDQGPGCKGQIGCRAGECVCTCSCP